MNFYLKSFLLNRSKRTEEEYKLKLKLAKREIDELKGTLTALENESKQNKEGKQLYDQR